MILLSDDHLLLIHDSDPGVPGSSWWVLPGGGVDADEPQAEAAAREIQEETGLRLDPSQLGSPVARRRVVHGYSDRIRVQDETFFIANVARFEPSTDGWTDDERTRLKGFRWFPLAALPEDLWPTRARDIAVADPTRPLDLGYEEESTVPVTAAERAMIRHAATPPSPEPLPQTTGPTSD